MKISEKKYLKATEYELVKQTKKDNFTYLNRKYAKHGQTVLFGDSITEIFNWYELFEEYSQKTGKAVYNRGISGDFTIGLLNRLEDNVLNIKPKNITILIGTNDIGLNAPIEIPAENVNKLLNKITLELPQTNIILLAVFPVNNNMSPAAKAMTGLRRNADIKLLNTEYKKLSEKYNTKWLDLTAELSDENGNLDKNFCYDGLHLNAKGFEIAASNIIPLLE